MFPNLIPRPRLRWRRAIVVLSAVLPASGALGDGETVAGWAEQLASEDLKERREAAYALCDLGEGAAEAVPALIEALGDRDEQVWFQSVTALANIGPAAAPAVPALVEDLDGGDRRYDEQVTLRSAFALGRIGPEAVPALIEALRNEESSRSRAGAARALAWVGVSAAPAAEALAVGMADPEPGVRLEVARAVGSLGAAGLPLLDGGLADERPIVVATALDALAFHPDAGERFAEPVLRLAGEEAPEEARAKALPLLVPSGVADEAAAGVLVPALLGGSEAVSDAALGGLLRLEQVDSARPLLEPELAAGEEERRVRAARALGRMGWKASGATPSLVAAVAAEPEGRTADASVEALMLLGPSALPAVLDGAARYSTEDLGSGRPGHWVVQVGRHLVAYGVEPLRLPLGSEQPAIRYAALRVAAAPGVELDALRAEVLAAARSEDPFTRAASLPLLENAGVPATRFRELLGAALEDDRPVVRAAGIAVLAERPALASAFSEVIAEGLGATDPGLRSASIDALGALGAEGASMLDLLRSNLESSGPDDQVKLLAVVASFDEVGEEGVALVGDYCRSESPAVREEAFRALGELRSDKAAPLFQSGLEDPEPAVRAAALAAGTRVWDGDARLAPLEAALGDEHQIVRHLSLELLGSMRGDARSAAPAIFRCLDNPWDREQAIGALRRIRPRDVNLYIEATRHESDEVRAFACGVLGFFGHESEEAVQALEEAVKADDRDVRRQAREALERIERRKREQEGG